MDKLCSPKQIPIHFFYFGWKKALSFVKSENCVYDPVEVEKFNYDLDQQLRKLQQQFREGDFVPCTCLPYLVPKSAKFDKETGTYIPRVRPMVQFSFRDQVAWATVMLVLAEWFDTNDEVYKLIPIQQHEQREAYRWMVPWSFNNRIKRIHQLNEYNGEVERLFVHYNHRQMYESFQWSLRSWREAQKQQFQLIREKYGKAYYGEMDIQEFYPSLKVNIILKALEARFEQLKNAGIVDDDSINAWINLLKRMCCFEVDFLDTFWSRLEWDIYHRKSMEKLVESILGQQQGDLKNDLQQLATFLKDSLPIGLISSGFLANCALTPFFDRPLEEYFREMEDQIFVTRYTDDIKFIGSSPKVIYDAMSQAHKLLENIELKVSRDKVNPPIDFEGDEKAAEGLPLFPFITKFDSIPGSTAIIEKLSQISDQKLWAMDHGELEQFIHEMLSLIDTRFDEQEIQDETKTAFAAWRLRMGAKEAVNRDIQVPLDRIHEALKNAVAKYPHKAALIDCYVMHLFDRSLQKDILPELDIFMKWFQEKQSDVINSPTDLLNHPILRTRLMLAIASYWYLLPYNKRKPIAEVILNNISNWYVYFPTWYEKAAIYWVLIVLGVERDIRAVDSKGLARENDLVQNIYRLYEFWRCRGDLLCDYDIVEGDNLQFSQANIYYLKTVFTIFWLRKGEEDRLRYNHLPEERDWVCSVWSKLERMNEKRLENNLYKDHRNVLLQLVWLLVKFCREEIPVFGFEMLLNVKFNDWVERGRERLFYEILHFFDGILHEWIDFPNRGHIQRLLNTLQNYGNCPSETGFTDVRWYVCQRLKNLAGIKLHMCKTKSGLEKLPGGILPESNGPLRDVPTLLDLLTVCSSKTGAQSGFVMKPLTEYEILCLMWAVISKNEQGELLRDLRTLGISYVDWTRWRSKFLEDSASNCTEGHERFVSIKHHENGCPNPDRFYIDNVISYLRELQNTGGTELSDDFDKCLNYAVVLAMLLSGGRLNGSAFDLPKMMQWRGTQYVINRCNAPSTGIVHLITDTINYLFQFYKYRYESLGYLKLPYRPYLSTDVIKFSHFKNIIKSLLNDKKGQYRAWSHGVLELRFINLDDMVKGEKL